MENTIKLAFYKASAPNATIIDKAVAFYTQGEYSHAELIIDNYMISSSPREGCVRIKSHSYDPQSWDYIKIPNINIDNIWKFFNKTKNKKYDWFGIFGFVVPIADSEKRYFCSEWVAKALIIGGCEPLFDKNPSKISPNRLAHLVQEDRIW